MAFGVLKQLSDDADFGADQTLIKTHLVLSGFYLRWNL
jgi:hypothetical protein